MKLRRARNERFPKRSTASIDETLIIALRWEMRRGYLLMGEIDALPFSAPPAERFVAGQMRIGVELRRESYRDIR